MDWQALIIAIVIWLVLGLGGAKAFSEKGRSYILGFILGSFLGPIGWLIILLSPVDKDGVLSRKAAEIQRKINSGEAKKCPFCAELIQPDAIICRYCGKEQPKNEIVIGESRTKKPDASNEQPENVIRIPGESPKVYSDKSQQGSMIGPLLAIITVIALLFIIPAVLKGTGTFQPQTDTDAYISPTKTPAPLQPIATAQNLRQEIPVQFDTVLSMYEKLGGMEFEIKPSEKAGGQARFIGSTSKADFESEAMIFLDGYPYMNKPVLCKASAVVSLHNDSEKDKLTDYLALMPLLFTPDWDSNSWVNNGVEVSSKSADYRFTKSTMQNGLKINAVFIGGHTVQLTFDSGCAQDW